MHNIKEFVNGKIIEIANGEDGGQAYIKIETTNKQIFLLTIKPSRRFLISCENKNTIFAHKKI